MTPLVGAVAIGAAAAAAGLAFVLLPVLSGQTAPGGPDRGAGGTQSAEGRPATSAAGEGAASAVDALREIEFDRQTGKLSDDDYAALRTTYTERALSEMRFAADRARAPVTARSDASQRPPLTCPVCGPRPESDAQYCSACARYLAGVCASCGAVVTESAARFCSGCGHQLAA
jgi:Double zinc ribbon